jgi:hypothetical protein
MRWVARARLKRGALLGYMSDDDPALGGNAWALRGWKRVV